VQVVDEHDQVVSVIRSDVPDVAPILGEVPFFLGINYLKAMKAGLDGDVKLEVCTCICIYVFMYIYARVLYMYIHVYTYICIYMHMYMHMYVYVYMYTYIHICIPHVYIKTFWFPKPRSD